MIPFRRASGHDLASLQRLCPTAIQLDEGRVVRRGTSASVVQAYLDTATARGGQRQWDWDKGSGKAPGPFVPRVVKILNHEGESTDRVNSVEPFFVEIEYDVTEPLPNLEICFTLNTGAGEGFASLWDPGEAAIAPGRYKSRCEVPGDMFAAGGFVLGLLCRASARHRLFYDGEILSFYIDDASDMSELGRSILKPRFRWERRAVGARRRAESRV